MHSPCVQVAADRHHPRLANQLRPLLPLPWWCSRLLSCAVLPPPLHITPSQPVCPEQAQAGGKVQGPPQHTHGGIHLHSVSAWAWRWFEGACCVGVGACAQCAVWRIGSCHVSRHPCDHPSVKTLSSCLLPLISLLTPHLLVHTHAAPALPTNSPTHH